MHIAIERMFGIIILEVENMYKIPIECIAEMKPNNIKPMRIRYEDDEGAHVVKVDRILKRDKKTIMPNMNQLRSIEYTFRCEAVQGDSRKPFTLAYNDQSCRWYMYIN